MKRFRRRLFAIGCSLASFTLAFAPAVAAPPQSTPCPGSQKCVKVDFSSSGPIVAGTEVETTMTWLNESAARTTIEVGSFNVTPPNGWVINPDPATITGPFVAGVPQGSAFVEGNVLKLRNLSTQVGQEGQVSFHVTPSETNCPKYKVEARQSNNFNPDTRSNTVPLDPASNLGTCPSADMKIVNVAQSPSNEDASAGNPVRYSITAGNGGPDTSGNVTLTVTTTSSSGTFLDDTPYGGGWTCSVGAAVTCTQGPLAAGSNAPVLDVRIVTSSAESFTTTATVSSAGTSDPQRSNDSKETPTSTKDPTTQCGTGQVNCATGDLKFDLETTIATAAVSLQRFAGASIKFEAVQCPELPASCSTVFHIGAPAHPEDVPVNGVFVQATFQLNYDNIPSVYPFVRQDNTCDAGPGGRCERGDPTRPADELWFFKTDEDGAVAQPIRDCNGLDDPGVCLEAQFYAFNIVTGRLELHGITHKPGGDGKVMGFCLRSVPIGAPC